MGYRYNLNDRIFGGSMEPRLNPKVVERQLNAKLGPERPQPLVRETSLRGCIEEKGTRTRGPVRRSLIGLPPRFDRS
jgi:hypothetical protein